jgi:hypothetical protein
MLRGLFDKINSNINLYIDGFTISNVRTYIFHKNGSIKIMTISKSINILPKNKWV